MSGDHEMEERVAALERSSARAGSLLLFGNIGLAVVLLTLIAWQFSLANAARAIEASQQKERLFWLLCHSPATTADRTQAFQRLVVLGNTECTK